MSKNYNVLATEDYVGSQIATAQVLADSTYATSTQLSNLYGVTVSLNTALESTIEGGNVLPRTLEENINDAISDFGAVAAAIQDHNIEISSGTATSEYPQKIHDVYNKGVVDGSSSGGSYDFGYTDGYTDGYAEGEAAGYEQGKADEPYYNEVWDRIRNDASVNMDHNYDKRFTGWGWNDVSFKPNFPIKPKRAQKMFEFSGVRTSPYLKEIDFNNCISFLGTFKESNVTELGVVDCSNASSGWGGINQMFYACPYLRKIEKLIFPKSSMVISAFESSSAIEEITFEGTAYQNISLQWAKKLSVESMKSLISCLYNYAGTDKEFTYSVKFSDESWAALAADSTAPDGGTWREYVQKLGWNI